MKEEVEKQKDEVRNMTMILESHGTLGDHPTDNILDELDNEASLNNGANNSLFNVSVSNTLNTSTKLNTSLNFLKSTSAILYSAKENHKGRG